MADPKKERYFLRSLANGIKALEAIAEANPSLSLSQLADILGTSKATATRICYTLSELELLQRNENNKLELTPNVLKFGYAAICVTTTTATYTNKELEKNLAPTLLDTAGQISEALIRMEIQEVK